MACRNCNEGRGDRCEGADPQTGEVVSLFNPRIERWSEHFAWDTSRTRLIGLTATGRATVELLDVNDDRHGGHSVRIRERDVADGYHPPVADPVLPD